MMRQVINETGRWMPFLFYGCNYRQLGLGAWLWLPVQWFARSLLHILLYVILAVVFTIIFAVSVVVSWVTFPGTLSFWEMQVGTMLIYTLIVITTLVPFRLARYPSYLLYSKIFRSRGLFTS